MLYPSKDEKGFGTINIASAVKIVPDRGWIAGNYGPTLVLAPLGGKLKSFKASLSITGNAALLWAHEAPLGPDAAKSDASVAAISRTGFVGVNFCDCGEWKLVEVPVGGKERIVASDSLADASAVELELEYVSETEAVLRVGGAEVYRGALKSGEGSVGFLVESQSSVEFKQLNVVSEGERAAKLTWLAEEALLGAAQSTEPTQWVKSTELPFRFGSGYVSVAPGVRGKWNVIGSGVRVWSPKGPQLGKVEVLVDGKSGGVLDLHAEAAVTSGVVYENLTLDAGPHAVVLRPVEGAIALDSLEVLARGR